MSGIVFVLTHMQDLIPSTVVVGLFVLLVRYSWKMSVPLRIPREFLVIALFLLYLSVNIAMNNTLQGISLIDFGKKHLKILYTLALLPLIYMIKPTVRFENALYRSAIVAGFLVSSVLLWCYFLMPSFSVMGVKFVQGDIIRGPLDGHGPMAGSLALPIMLFFVAVVEKYRGNQFVPVKVDLLTIGMVIVIALAFAFTKSRGRTLGLLFIVFLLVTPFIWDAVSKFKLSLKALSFCVLAFIIVLLSVIVLSSRLTDLEEDENVLSRFLLWSRAVQFITTSPLTGLGLGSFEQVNVKVQKLIPGLIAIRISGTYPKEITRHVAEGGQHSHNTYLQLLCELGLIGTLLFLLVLTLGIMRFLPDRSRVPPGTDSGFDYVLGQAHFNRKLAASLFVFLSISGMTTGYTLSSPPACWVLYICVARFIRQHAYIRKVLARTPDGYSVA